MTLKEVIDLLYTTTTREGNRIVVFDDEEEADNWIERLDDKTIQKDNEIVCVIESDYKPEVFLNEKILSKCVLAIYAIDRDLFVVLIERVLV